MAEGGGGTDDKRIGKKRRPTDQSSRRGRNTYDGVDRGGGVAPTPTSVDGVDAPQERGAIIFAQGCPIGRSIVPTVVVCARVAVSGLAKTRVKSVAVIAAVSPLHFSLARALARVRFTRDATVPLSYLLSLSFSPFPSFFVPLSLFPNPCAPALSAFFVAHPPRPPKTATSAPPPSPFLPRCEFPLHARALYLRAARTTTESANPSTRIVESVIAATEK